MTMQPMPDPKTFISDTVAEVFAAEQDRLDFYIKPAECRLFARKKGGARPRGALRWTIDQRTGWAVFHNDRKGKRI
jgi:hypothetical protein